LTGAYPTNYLAAKNSWQISCQFLPRRRICADFHRHRHLSAFRPRRRTAAARALAVPVYTVKSYLGEGVGNDEQQTQKQSELEDPTVGVSRKGEEKESYGVNALLTSQWHTAPP
jgi:hypothetical protein